VYLANHQLLWLWLGLGSIDIVEQPTDPVIALH
jgi:hypothetical protein